MFNEHSDSVPGAVRQLVALFEQELANVEFPGVGLASLGAHIEAVEASATTVQELEGQLGSAREVLAEQRRALSRHAEQAVAYLRVFAADRPTLQERVSALELTRAVAAPPPERKRGRPRTRPAPPSAERGPSELPLGTEPSISRTPATDLTSPEPASLAPASLKPTGLEPANDGPASHERANHEPASHETASLDLASHEPNVTPPRVNEPTTRKQRGAQGSRIRHP